MIRDILMENYGNISNKEIIKVKDLEIIIDIEGIDLESTIHSRERQKRHFKGYGKFNISSKAINKAIQKAIGEIINDFANGELANNEKFVIRANQRKSEPLNIVAVLNMNKGKDTLKAITVMVKDVFFHDHKEYEVNL